MKIETELEIESRLTKVETLLERMSTNELPHIQAGVDKILWWIIGGFTTVFCSLIIHAIITYIQNHGN